MNKFLSKICFPKKKNNDKKKKKKKTMISKH